MKLSEIAYHDFKKALLSRKIVPGDTMTQASLAKILKTQISPLRIAMHRLETEGLVKILPRSGIHIVKPDLSVIRDSYHLRKIIETEAIKTYARYATDSAIDGLISKNDLVLEKLRKSGISPEDLREADKIDKLMHRDFIDALSNPLIAQVYETNNDKIGVVRLDQPNALSPVILEEIVIEHLKILTAIKERDPDKAGKALVDHLDASLKRAMGIF